MLFSTSEAGRLLGISASRLKKAEEAGEIAPARRVVGLGVRVYDDADMERLREWRKGVGPGACTRPSR